MSAKNPSLFFKTKEQLFSAKEDYERMGFAVKYDLNTLTLTIYQDTSKSKKQRERDARNASRRDSEYDKYQDIY